MIASRKRIELALNHQEAERIPLDLGASPTTGMRGAAETQ
jgi:hypothetical protein